MLIKKRRRILPIYDIIHFPKEKLIRNLVLNCQGF